MTDMIDLKGRIGVPRGNLLVYGVLGYSTAGRSFGGSLGDVETRADGLSFGLGLDVLVSERLFVGIEYLQRDLKVGEGKFELGDPELSIDHDLDTIS